MFIPLWVITLLTGMIAGAAFGIYIAVSSINDQIDKAKERKTNT